jgi:tetratricopeptide (TPR) repeat protein
MKKVTLRDETVMIPTYRPETPEPHPMFLDKRVYQGSSGKVYPLPFIDRIKEDPMPTAWRSITLENEYLEVQILPEIGGRIHRLRDKTNNYDVIYHQTVIKPALVGLAGPWISGGIEFNWPQHHRPSTFMPAQVEWVCEDDGSVVVWLSEHDPMARMKGMHGVRLRPGRAVLEVEARIFNRTADVQTFLWWANVATRVHGRYQSFFPEDATFVADHAKRAMSTFPHCSGNYYGVDYAGRARGGVPTSERPPRFAADESVSPNDLSWYANIPVPTSYMCLGTKEAFFGGYDHEVGSGIIHVANPHISPGKKQWTWGNHDFGYAWDRLLTDADSDGLHHPYIELMAGVYTDNQPDFSYLQPGETKSWRQFWYPIRGIGPAHQANEDCAASLTIEGAKVRIAIHATTVLNRAGITLFHCGKKVHSFTRRLSPEKPFLSELSLPKGVQRKDLSLTVTVAGREILSYTPPPPPKSPAAEELADLAATEPPAPMDVASVDELYLTGLHLEQYRHATRSPEPYWQEGLRRDSGDSRCNLALGRWHLRRGECTVAEAYLTASIRRFTHRNPNPADGEAYFQLGRCLRFLGRDEEAYAAFYKATWNQAWVGPGCHALAEMDCRRGNWGAAEEHLERSLEAGSQNSRARALQIIVLRRLNKSALAGQILEEALRRDPLDAWLRLLAEREWRGDNGIRLDLAFDLTRAGLEAEALALLTGADRTATDGSLPMVDYGRAWLADKLGQRRRADQYLQSADGVCVDFCFPSRLEEIAVLERVIALAPKSGRPHALLGHLLYDRGRGLEAIRHWESAVRANPDDAVVWRCLGIAYFNLLGRPAAAKKAYARARALAPRDARLLFEADQLAKRLAAAPSQRLRLLSREGDLVARRDDLTVELCALHNQTGSPEKARALLDSRRFQPWEGGEGQALGQYVRSELLLGWGALARGDAKAALKHFNSALSAPENLGEAKHLLANQSDIHFWIGEALWAVGKKRPARKAWRTAAEARGDFQQMSVKVYSELSWFSALALRRLGREEEATSLFRALLAYGRQMEKEEARIDYFATSLPTMLLFHDDLTKRQANTARCLQAQALYGLGRRAAARKLMGEVLKCDPSHGPAADFLIVINL